MFDARSITGGIARPVRLRRLYCPEAAHRRGLSQRSALGMIDGDCSSNSRSRSICVLRLPGSSGSAFRNARSLPPISSTIARLCWGSISMRLCIGSLSKKAPASAQPLTQLPACERGWQFWNGTGDRRFWLSVRALVVENSGPRVGTFGYPRHAPCSLTASDGLMIPKY